MAKKASESSRTMATSSKVYTSNLYSCDLTIYIS